MFEETLAIIKPNGVAGRVIGKVHTVLEEFGFVVRATSIILLTIQEAEEFYKAHLTKPFFPSLVHFLSSGPIVAMTVAGPNAITRLRNLIGNTNPLAASPGTIRFLYGETLQNNTVHGSDSLAAARRELALLANKPMPPSLPSL